MLLPGTGLAFEEEVRCETGIVFSWRLGHTVAKFQEINKVSQTYIMTPLSFPTDKSLLLTRLCKGQRATVLQLPAPLVPADDEQHDSLAV